jgi:prepilin-type N-terminal cleavage/methylation domain-containing protein
MLQKLKKRNENGFTIIEVLIVLAIAGLILLVVFLAVPALQRNSRNTQRKNDVSALLGAVSEYTNNNAGVLPTADTQIESLAKTGYYKAGDISLAAGTQGALTADSVRVVTGAKCVESSGVPTGATTATGASARQFASQYMIETSGGLQATCQES